MHAEAQVAAAQTSWSGMLNSNAHEEEMILIEFYVKEGSKCPVRP